MTEHEIDAIPPGTEGAIRNMQFPNAFPVPTGSNADEWHCYLSENKDALPMVSVQIAEAIEAAEARIWVEFVSRCEALETGAGEKLETLATDRQALSGHEGGFYRGQSYAAKSIRRSVNYPAHRHPTTSGSRLL